MPILPRCFFPTASTARTGRQVLLILNGLLAAGGLSDHAMAAEPDELPTLSGQFCTNTAKAVHTACTFEVQDDYWLAVGNCRNIPNTTQAATCLRAAERDRRAGLQECGEQFAARREVCGELGEAAYSPAIHPGNFVARIDHPYFPLKPGTTMVYRKRTREGVEQGVVTVTDRTETILGVRCTVVRDTVTLDGELIEDTLDWFAQDRQGNVWYFGEIAQNFEDGRLVDLDGSWRAGEEGAKPGIIMKAAPRVGDVYRQEFALGEAEDVGEVLSLGGQARVPAASCSNCLVTRDFTPLEPDVEEHKFYAPGIGLILEVDQETGERVELVEIRRR